MIRDAEEGIARFERGDVVWGIDPFKRDSDGNEDDDGTGGLVPRPWLVISTQSVPFHPEQYLCLTLTTRTWHDEAIPIPRSGWVVGGAPESTSVLPWSVAAIKHDLLDTTGELVARLDISAVDEPQNGFQGRLEHDLVDAVTRRLIGYLEGTLAS